MRLWTRQSPLILFLLYLTVLCVGERSPEEWKKVLKNQQGDGPCEIKNWMQSAECGSGHKRRSFERNVSIFTQRADKADSNHSSTACTCSDAFYNVLCGCWLINGAPVDDTFSLWKNKCDSDGLPTQADRQLLDPVLRERLPNWAFIGDSNGTFNQAEVYDAALNEVNKFRWSVIQIVTPIIVGSCLLVLVVAILISWSRYKKLRKTKNYPHFTNYIRGLFKFRAESVHHQGRDGSWDIDPPDRAENSRWSPSTTSPGNAGNIPGRQLWAFPGSRYGSMTQTASLSATVKSIGNRVKEFIPWKSRPAYVVNMPPSTSYNIDPDRSTLGSMSRKSTRTTRDRSRANGGGIYTTISEVDDEIEEHSGKSNERSSNEQRRAENLDISDDVILIRGDRPHFSINTLGTPITQLPQNRNGTTDLTMHLRVESPSPTLETLHLTPETPGAPPLLPPAPKAPAPVPPSITRATPRRTPSPRLHIQIAFNHATEHSRNAPTTNLKAVADSSNQVPTHPPIQPPVSNLQQPSLLQTEQQQLAATSSKSNNPYLNIQPSSSSISYASLQKPYTSASAVSVADPTRVLRPLPPQPQFPSPFSPAPAPAPALLSSTTRHQPETSIGGVISPASGLPKLEPLRRQNGSGNSNSPPEPSPPVIHHQHHQHQHSFSSTSLTPLRRNSNSLSSDDLRQEQPPQKQHHYKGWSAGDDNDRTSLLMNRSPMSVDDHSVYMATPRDVVMVKGSVDLNHHYHANDHDHSGRYWSSDSYTSLAEQSPLQDQHSPTLSELEADPNVIPGLATGAIGIGNGTAGLGVGMGLGLEASYAGRESLYESSGWDASTQEGTNYSPIAYKHTNHFGTSPSTSSFLEPGPGPVGSSLGLGHKSRMANRSREDMVFLSRSDPAMLFPGSVRAAGYLVPMTSPVPSTIPSPRPNNLALEVDHYHGNGNGEVGNRKISEEDEGERRGSLTGGTWDTESSGILSAAIHQPQHHPQSQSESYAKSSLQKSQHNYQQHGYGQQINGHGHGPSFTKRTP